VFIIFLIRNNFSVLIILYYYKFREMLSRLKNAPDVSLVCNGFKLQSCVCKEANEDFKSVVCTMGW
jgi:hypothetical protein